MSGTPQIPEGVRVAQQARAELYDTLGQLRERLDYAQRIDDRLARTRQQIAAARHERPMAFAVGVIGVAVTAGLVVWGAARRVVRAFE